MTHSCRLSDVASSSRSAQRRCYPPSLSHLNLEAMPQLISGYAQGHTGGLAANVSQSIASTELLIFIGPYLYPALRHRSLHCMRQWSTSAQMAGVTRAPDVFAASPRLRHSL